MSKSIQHQLRTAAMPLWQWVIHGRGQSFEQAHAEIIHYINEFIAVTKACQVSHAEKDNMLYAIVACIDEAVANSNVLFRQQWMAKPLQWVYFQETNAGEGFFSRLDKVLAESEWYVLEYYYLAIILGFKGCYARDPVVALLVYQDKLKAGIKVSQQAQTKYATSMTESLFWPVSIHLAWLAGLSLLAQWVVSTRVAQVLGVLS